MTSVIIRMSARGAHFKFNISKGVAHFIFFFFWCALSSNYDMSVSDTLWVFGHIVFKMEVQYKRTKKEKIRNQHLSNIQQQI